ncbi:hypothetical protein [Modestobacter versicolor]|uniref:Uncharacterized protein n=1 Tax=Modestobacter versicolor TaxID=429133 RepID=A0A323VBF7_9ACTN|nr:hypothetical protein [Modestobacter versicolor]MBB3676535.1 hypothetical protein [Modestobacter versicolor]PZA21373.1 hypothetical protein DMO24_10665 [Modestobacter versicolor]
MISPFRGDVVLTGFVLAIPVLLLGMRGDFSADDVITRLLWCLAAGWVAVTVVRLASTPPVPPKKTAEPAAAGAEPDGEPAPA